jgi:hypothetical protein
VGVSLTFSGNIGTNNLSHFEVFDIYGTPFILAYSNVTGAARIYEVSSYGTVVSTSWSQSGWDTDWTHFSSFSHNGTVYLLSYKSLSGRISYTIISYYYDYYLNKWAFGSYAVTPNFWTGGIVIS